MGIGACTLVWALGANAALAAAEPFVLLDRVRVESSTTARAQLRGGAGDVAVQRYELEFGGSTPVGAVGRLTHGLVWSRTELDRTGGNLLPETLQEVALRLGWQQVLTPHWRLVAVARPGFYGNGGAVGSDAFNVPLLALASYGKSRDLAWSFGVVANAFGDNPVLPVAGVRWTWTPGWTLQVGLPRAGVEWQVNEQVTVAAGASLQGGAYRLTRNPSRGSAAGARLADAKLDYREIRLGVATTWNLNAALAFTADVGTTVDQRFDYHQHGVVYRGSHELYVALGLNAKF